MSLIPESFLAERDRVLDERDRRMHVLAEVISDNPGPWGYKDLVGQLIEKAGPSTHGYPSHAVDVMIKDGVLTSRDGVLFVHPTSD